MASAGDFNRRVTLQKRIDTMDAYGQKSTGWSDIATVWAHVQPLSATQTTDETANRRELDMLVTIRHRPSLVQSGDWRVLYAGRHYDVIGARDPHTAHDVVVMECKETRL